MKKELDKMDPEQTLSEIRYLFKEISGYYDLIERFEALDEWLSKGGFSPWPASSEPNRFANGQARMSDAQRNKLWQMCADYNVKFNENNFIIESNGMVIGWIGDRIEVGVELNGRSHT